MPQVDDDYEANKRVAASLKEYVGRRLNVMNAFETPILEGLMAAVKVEPLQSIGTVLDASAKCYAYRVDNTYGACYKVLLAAGGKEKDENLQEEEGQNDQNEDGVTNPNNNGGDINGTNTSSDGDDDENGNGDKQGKHKLPRTLDSSSKNKQLMRESRQLAEGLWKRFCVSEHFGNSEDDLSALFEQLSTDIVGTMAKRRFGVFHGTLDRKDNQFAIEDPIYRKVSKDFEEGSARSFVSNEVLMNDHGNFLLLHTNWPGDEPYQPLPLLVNHLLTASTYNRCQREAIDQIISVVNRAQSNRPSEYALLAQICADDEQSLPMVDFQVHESFGQRIDCAVGHGFDGGRDEVGTDNGGVTAEMHGVTMQEDNTMHLCQMEMDGVEPITNPPFADLTVVCTNLDHDDLGDIIVDETFDQQTGAEIVGEALPIVSKREGEAFGAEVAEREKQLAGGDENIDEEQNARLIDENLLPLTQTDNGNFVPLKNTLIDDASHWMGDHNLDHDLTAADQVRIKKGKAKRPVNEAGSAKAVTKRRQQKANDFGESNAIADDMCWIPKRVVSSYVKNAIADIQQTSLAKKRLEMNDDFVEDVLWPLLNRKLTRDRAKQLESMAYDPINLLRTRIFYKSQLGFWSFYPFDETLPKRIRPIRRPHVLSPFSLPPPLNEQYNEFNKLYNELVSGQTIADAAEEDTLLANGEENGQMEDGDSIFGDQIAVDAEFAISPRSVTLDRSPRRRKRGIYGTDDKDDGSNNGFGFLNNIALSEIKLIYHQTNLNVAKVKKAILKVISSQTENVSANVDILMGQDGDGTDADEEDGDDLSSCSSAENELELSDADDAVDLNCDHETIAAPVQVGTTKLAAICVKRSSTFTERGAKCPWDRQQRIIRQASTLFERIDEAELKCHEFFCCFASSLQR